MMFNWESLDSLYNLADGDLQAAYPHLIVVQDFSELHAIR
jgi:hypothetical protein